jgi:ectoine hydroxylase-related dioxygenase (phytanoyl-CoA dioxygenase family)
MNIRPYYTQSIENLKTLGYTKISQAIDKWEVDYLLVLVQKYYEESKDKVSKDVPRLNNNQPNIYNLQNKDINFVDILLKNETLEEILKYFLNDKWYKQIPPDQPNYILRHLGARSSNEALPLHIDSFIPYKGGEVMAIQVAIMLEDSSIKNGCTLVVPGTHQSGAYADKNFLDKAIPLEAKAGDILIWDSRLWHGTTGNDSKGTRWAIISTFTRWFIKQMFNIPEALPEEIKKQLSPKEKSILGFSSISYNTEFEGIEMKKGYE